MIRLVCALLTAATLSAAPNRLLVISVDGMDTRYLHDADKLGLKIPTLRRFMKDGAVADGVVGVTPTVTWPSHTTMVTGVVAADHGIVSNDQPGQPGQRWWFTHFLKARTLWQAALEAKVKTATIYWPVTTGAPTDFNFPEFWVKRGEHDVAFSGVADRATAGLVEKVAKVYPTFRRDNWDDEAGMQAVRYLLEFEQPGLTLVHIADLDSEEHDHGAFSPQAKAALEKADKLIGWALEKRPKGTVVAIVSDHGFENVDKVVRPKVITRDAEVSNGLIGVRTVAAANAVRGRECVGREVPMDEVRRFEPAMGAWFAAFDTAPGCVPSRDTGGPAVSSGDGKGTHGLWPTRSNYRASFLLWGEGVRKAKLGEISMLQHAPTFAGILELKLPAAAAPSLWPRAKK